MSRTQLATLAFLPVLLMGCTPKEDDDSGTSGSTSVDCTTEARASVQVNLLDAASETISGAALTYDAGDGANPCEEMVDGLYVCGWELAGTLRISAAAEGFAADEVDVEVESDVCHVITETIDLVLTPE